MLIRYKRVSYVSYVPVLSLSQLLLMMRMRALPRESQAVIVIRYRRALSAKFEPGTGVRRRQGVPASTTGKLMRYHGLTKVQEKQSNLYSHSRRNSQYLETILFVFFWTQENLIIIYFKCVCIYIYMSY